MIASAWLYELKDIEWTRGEYMLNETPYETSCL